MRAGNGSPTLGGLRVPPAFRAEIDGCFLDIVAPILALIDQLSH